MAPSSVIDNSSNRPILWQLRPNALSEGDEEEWQEYDEPEGENPHVVDGLTYTLMATGLVDIPQPPSKRVNEETRVIDPTRTPGKPYMHEAIDPTNEIRILTLLPFETDELRCTLGTARLVDKPFYEALSYVWGNPVFDDFIQIGDEELAITSSLGIALRNLRHTDRPRQLWIDAICINQSDNVEKGHQVGLMAQIYGLCSEAIGWLGEEYEETNDAIHIFHYLAENSWKFGINPTAPLEQGLTHHVGIGIQLALNNLYPRIDWPALTAWFSQEYFSRLWIVQEVALAPKIKLFNGPKEISIDTFTVAMRFIQFVLRHKQIGQYWSREYLRSWELIILRAAVKDTEQTEPPTMLDLVVKNATRKCADNHDRIYAMLGLKNHFENSTLKVDYTSNIEQLYQDFALSYLKEGNLKPLHYAGAVIETDPDDYENYWLEATLPTWTPDWRHYYPRTKLCSDHENKPIFSAATAIPPTIIIQQARLPAIGITGRTIDIVEATVATLLDQPWDTRPIKDLGHSTDSNPHMPFSAYFFYVGHLNGIPFDTESEAEIAWPDPSKNKKYPNGEDAETAYARTWMLDNRHPITALTLGDATTMSGRLSAIKSAWKDGKQSIVGPKTGTVFQWHIEQKNITAAVRQTTVGRAFFISKEGWIGLGPVPVRPGDRIVVFEGAETPFVLRKVGSNGDDDGEKTEKKEEWQVLGDAYVHGFMDGEGLSQTYEGSRQVFWVR